jgi:cytochrome c-type biogenesis protein CcmH/NrfG
MRLRRRQKWVFFALAIVFAATFAGVGVGSGSGGLDQLYSGLFGGGGDAVSKAQGEIKKNPVKGYRDLATAYEANGDTASAITALTNYLRLKKKNTVEWEELGGLQASQAQALKTQYQQAQQAAQLADPSQTFLPGGTLGQAVGTNVAYQGASQQATSEATQLYQQYTTTSADAVNSYKTAVTLQPHNATALQGLATAAQSSGDYKTALKAWKSWLKVSPNAPQRGQIEALVKQLKAALAPAKVTQK